MNKIVDASIITISKSKSILNGLTNKQLTNTNIPPYHSCVGTHIRHILDFYHCIFKGIKTKYVDLTDRERDLKVEQDCDCALQNIEMVIKRLEALKSFDPQTKLMVVDDLGQGSIEIEYSLGALLAQANSHTIHHYAIVSYILDRMHIVIKDETFGYNPTTPIPKINLN
jgi:ketopantoate reductase